MLEKTLLTAFAVATLAGCVSTSVSSFAAGGGAVPVKYSRVAVMLASSDLKWRREAEDAFASKDSTFVQSYRLFYPGHVYGDAERNAILQQNHVDAVLVISVGSSGVQTSQLPDETSSTCAGAATTYYQTTTATVNCKTSTTPGAELNKPWADWRAQMYDAQTRSSVWMASADSRGNAFANWSSIIRSMVGHTVGKLKADGLISGN